MIGIIGTGSWGTSLANLVAKNGHSAVIYGRDEEIVNGINRSRKNSKFHPGITLHTNLSATNNLEEILQEADKIIFAAPSHSVRSFYAKMASMGFRKPFISTAKGIEHHTLKTISHIAKEYFPTGDVERYFCVLSGPSFAYDVIRDIPTAVTLASQDDETLHDVKDLFHARAFQVFLSHDVVGVELAGALKNVIALAAGATDGFGFGQSTRAALVARGIAEISRIGIALGAKSTTFSGLSGLGDLIVTCTSNLSRNRRVGLMLAQGKTFKQTIKEIGQVAEGVRTTKSAWKLSKKLNIETPIIEEIYQSLYGKKTIADAVENILNRESEIEND